MTSWALLFPEAASFFIFVLLYVENAVSVAEKYAENNISDRGRDSRSRDGGDRGRGSRSRDGDDRGHDSRSRHPRRPLRGNGSRLT